LAILATRCAQLPPKDRELYTGTGVANNPRRKILAVRVVF